MQKPLLIVLLQWNIYGLTFAQSTLVLQPDGVNGKDAEIFSCAACGYADMNYGNKKDLNAIAWTNSGNFSNIRSLIQFDLTAIPANATVTDARLSLFYNPTSSEGQHSGSNAVLIQKIVNPWLENTVTWNNQPATTTTGQVLLPASVSNTQDYLNINLTALVQQMVCTPATNYGFMLRQQTESIFRKSIFASSDNVSPSLRPKLIITYTLPLPVELISFNAVAQATSLQLRWTTSSEKINSGFDVERSIDLLHFERLSTVEGHGTTNVLHHYFYEDVTASEGIKYFYRLRQVDFDGRYEYSPVIAALLPVQEIEFYVDWKRSSSQAHIYYNLSKATTLSVLIYNLSGHQVFELSNRWQEAGSHELLIPAGMLPGVENIGIAELITNEQVITRKFRGK